MAKEVVQELEQEVDGIGEGVEEVRQPDPIAAATPARQPEKSNLDSNEDFRKWKSEYDRKLANAERAANQERQRYQQMIADQESRLRERELAGMDDYQRANYERDEALRMANHAAAQLRDMQTQMARTQALTVIANKAKIPVSALEEASSEGHAWQLAWDYAQQQLEERERQATYESAEKREQREQKRAANKVDVGVGQPSTPTNDWERDYAKAKATGSAVELAKFLIPNRGK
jgi:hypothetical protein